jgi:MFS family permease
MYDNKLKTKGLFIWGICALFFLYEFFLRTVIGTYQHSFMQDLNLTSFQFSLLSTTIFLLIYGIMQIPAGIIVDNIGLKKSLLIASIACTIASIGFSYSQSFYVALLYRMLMGFGASFGFICLLISVHDWMPHKYSAIFIGLSQFIGTLGPMLAAGPLDSISGSTGINWRFVFLCLGIAGAVLIALIFFFVENNKHNAGKHIILYRPEKISISLLKLFSKIQPWYIALISTCLYFTIEYLSENEGRTFLELKGISSNSSSYIITIGWIGFAIGCPLLGFLSDILKRRKAIMKLCSILGLIAILMIVYMQSKLYIQIAFFLLGVSAGGQSIGFATITEQVEKRFIAVALGLNNAMIIGFVAINAPLIGFLLDHTIKEISNSLDAYLFVFNILIIISASAVILSIFFLKETFCKSAVDFTFLTEVHH